MRLKNNMQARNMASGVCGGLPTFRRLLGILLAYVILVCIAWISFDKQFIYHKFSFKRSNSTDGNGKQIRTEQKSVKPVLIKEVTIGAETIRYERCMHIPDPPKGKQWSEEQFIHDPPVTDLATIVNPAKSVIRLLGQNAVKLGDTFTLHIELYDGLRNKRKGGDSVQAWMRNIELGAGAVAHVTDNMDGSYKASFVAIWSGKANIRVAVIAPREVIAIQFRRRYICPPTLASTGIFLNNGRVETQCSFYPQVPGRTQLCNLTQDNYGRPLYCAKPSDKKFDCNTFGLAGENDLWRKGFDKQLFTPIEKQLLTRNYQAMVIPHNITMTITSDKEPTVGTNAVKCNTPDRRHTWPVTEPIGYLYKHRWYLRSCTGRNRALDVASCVKNTKIVMIGDSTVRQIFASMTDMIPCEWGTEKINKHNKHTAFSCENKAMNYGLEFCVHELPFATQGMNHHYAKSVKAYLAPFEGAEFKGSKIVILINMFIHFKTSHSHVIYEALHRMKQPILDLLDKNPNAYVMIKGPNSYAFELHVDHNFIRKPQIYRGTYIEYYKQVFRDVQDRVIYLDQSDITTATEQASLHPEENVVRETIYKMFDFICDY